MCDSQERSADVPIDLLEVRPWCCNFHRVDDEPFSRQSLKRARIVSVLHPTNNEVRGDRVTAVSREAFLVDDRHGRSDTCGVALIENQESTRRSVTTVTSLRLDLVVQAQNCWGGPSLDDTPACIDPSCEFGEEICAALLAARQWMASQPHTGDDAEGAFASDEDIFQVGSTGCSRCGSELDD
jgi:hypothetical protein